MKAKASWTLVSRTIFSHGSPMHMLYMDCKYFILIYFLWHTWNSQNLIISFFFFILKVAIRYIFWVRLDYWKDVAWLSRSLGGLHKANVLEPNTLLKILSYAIIMFATGMQLPVACNYARFFMQLQWIFGPFLGVYVCNYGATMITFIQTFGWFLWYIIVYIWYAYTHSCMCNQNTPTMVFW
jgi:hypothetical protein